MSSGARKLKKSFLPVALALFFCSCASIGASAEIHTKPVERVTTLATFMDCTPESMTMATLLRMNFPASKSLRAATQAQTPPLAPGHTDDASTPESMVSFIERINTIRRAAGARELRWSSALGVQAQEDLDTTYKNSNIDRIVEVQKSAPLPPGASLHVARRDESRKPPYRCELMDVFKDWEANYTTLISLLDYRYTRIGVASIRGRVRPSDSKTILEDTYHANFVIELGRAEVPEPILDTQSPIAVIYPPPASTGHNVLPGSFVLVQLREGEDIKLEAVELRKEIWGKVLNCMFCAMPGADTGVLYDTWAHQLPMEGVIAGTTYFAKAKGTHSGKPFEKNWSFSVASPPGTVSRPQQRSRFDISEQGTGLRPPDSYGTSASDAKAGTRTRTGKLLSYTADQVRGPGGKLIRVPGAVFIGTQVERLPDGQCRTLTIELVEMKTFVDNGVTREQPITRKAETTMPCSAAFTNGGHGEQ